MLERSLNTVIVCSIAVLPARSPRPMSDIPDKKAIVVVEDNEAIGELIRDTLNAEPDYQAAIVRDGSLAIEAIRSVKTCLILLDINLPGLNGLQIYDMLQTDEATSGIPVLFVTASPD